MSLIMSCGVALTLNLLADEFARQRQPLGEVSANFMLRTAQAGRGVLIEHQLTAALVSARREQHDIDAMLTQQLERLVR